MNEKILDERYFFADEAIIDSLFLLLKEKDIEHISVSDVIKKAGIKHIGRRSGATGKPRSHPQMRNLFIGV